RGRRRLSAQGSHRQAGRPGSAGRQRAQGYRGRRFDANHHRPLHGQGDAGAAARRRAASGFVVAVLLTVAQALVLGFSVAAQVGPIGVLCIRRTLSDGRTVGLACGLGAATADALYGLIAGLGLAALSSVAMGSGSLFRVVGALYLAFLGVRTF